ncbi:MAG: hypothetical protein LJF06_16825 [Gemmatimonadetes bacterium]|nr:hypothetical protein [Gemmatimonadota bacterium]
MRRQLAVLMLALGAGVVGTPSPATAQVSVGVQLYWEWNDGAWRPHRYEWNARRSAYYVGGRAVWVPRAYMPPAGYCREWIPGVPVWRQPPAVPCDRLFHTYRYARAGVVILGGLGYAGPMIRYDRDGWYDRDGRRRPVVPYEWNRRERRVIYEARPPRTVYKENPRRVIHEDRSPRGERERVAVPRTPRADRGQGRDGARGRDRGNAARGNRGNGNHGNNGNGNHGRGRGGG